MSANRTPPDYAEALDGQPLVTAFDLIDEAQVPVVERGADRPVAVSDVLGQLFDAVTAGEAVSGERRVVRGTDPRVLDPELEPLLAQFVVQLGHDANLLGGFARLDQL
ncbi:hypothetical protein [Frankia sp. Cas4]|uniref:hypothetical protein n=1 Tax=Frankia sp. Cas4 TaxID=3073927 RepID=UPI002AD4F881|nr:hypothetical protein [Frankia sp. Cas4]